MGTKSPVMMSELGSGVLNGDDLGKEFGYLLREQRKQDTGDRERELNVCRSGSAPPTVEGSTTAIEFLNDDELRSDPAYLSYYYSNVNLNPRLPPPVLSKEDWRSTQRLGGIGDRRKPGGGPGGGSLYSRQLGFQKEDDNGGGGEWVSGGGDGLIGLSLGRQQSFAEIFQDDSVRTTAVPDYSSRPASHSAFDGDAPICSYETRHAHRDISSSAVQPGRNVQNMAGLQNKPSQTFASVLTSSVSRNTTPDPQQLARASSPSLQNVGNHGEHSFNVVFFSETTLFIHTATKHLHGTLSLLLRKQILKFHGIKKRIFPLRMQPKHKLKQTR